MIYFIGDEPSKQNIDSEIAFVGTRSYKTLLMWIATMDLDINEVMLANKNQLQPGKWVVVNTKNLTSDIDPVNDKVIALGQNASDYLKALDVEHYKMEHPSGLNRNLNDMQYVKKKLKECKEYINGF